MDIAELQAAAEDASPRPLGADRGGDDGQADTPPPANVHVVTTAPGATWTTTITQSALSDSIAQVARRSRDAAEQRAAAEHARLRARRTAARWPPGAPPPPPRVAAARARSRIAGASAHAASAGSGGRGTDRTAASAGRHTGGATRIGHARRPRRPRRHGGDPRTRSDVDTRGGRPAAGATARTPPRASPAPGRRHHRRHRARRRAPATHRADDQTRAAS